MTRRRFGFAKWTIRPDERDHLPLAVFAIECCACEERSDATDNSGLPGQDWALRHTARNPEHREYVMTARTFWCVEPAEGNPYLEVDR